MSALDKLSKLLNLAERAGTQAEADAFFAKAQELATLHAISLEQARAHGQAAQKREEPVQEQITIGAPRQHVNSHLVLLAVGLGEVNSVRLNVAHNSTYLIAFGLPGDVETLKMLLSSIGAQMVQSADRFVRSREWAGEVDWETGKPMTAQKARKSYYTRYVEVISARLREARRDAERAFDAQARSEGGAALVLRGKEVEVADFYARTSTARGSWRGARRSGASRTAQNQASSDARSARLNAPTGIGGSRRQVSA